MQSAWCPTSDTAKSEGGRSTHNSLFFRKQKEIPDVPNSAATAGARSDVLSRQPSVRSILSDDSTIFLHRDGEPQRRIVPPHSRGKSDHTLSLYTGFVSYRDNDKVLQRLCRKSFLAQCLLTRARPSNLVQLPAMEVPSQSNILVPVGIALIISVIPPVFGS